MNSLRRGATGSGGLGVAEAQVAEFQPQPAQRSKTQNRPILFLETVPKNGREGGRGRGGEGERNSLVGTGRGALLNFGATY